jgi:hypothetical protein
MGQLDGAHGLCAQVSNDCMHDEARLCQVTCDCLPPPNRVGRYGQVLLYVDVNKPDHV